MQGDRPAVVPAAVMGVMFPAFSRAWSADRASLRGLFGRGQLYLLGLMAPPMALLGWLAEPLLGWWLGPEFAARAAPVAR